MSDQLEKVQKTVLLYQSQTRFYKQRKTAINISIVTLPLCSKIIIIIKYFFILEYNRIVIFIY